MDDKIYDFKRYSITDRFLICPGCFETLVQEDIEDYHQCPFCNYRFELNSEIEDFLLQPLVDHWVYRETSASVLQEQGFRAVITEKG